MPAKKPHISVIIPTLNEEGNIRRVIKRVDGALDGDSYEILVVDGYSDDRTAQIALSLGARVIYDRKGKGSALIKGFRSARGDILVSIDADLSNEPKEMRLLIDSIEIGYDICMGSRFITGGGTQDMPLIRRIGNRFFVMLVNLFFHAHYSDLCYGYRSFRKDKIGKLGLKESRFAIETEISIMAAKKHLKVIEIPSVEKRRDSGEAKLRTFSDGWSILRTILANLQR
ncbi:MAG: glycosyltransferase family 2 protein [Candidatus Marsarchaeota archaeon]|nr:glycosyltransferase family 2 protein [Candidatus Marsarchaeota archaeon]